MNSIYQAKNKKIVKDNQLIQDTWEWKDMIEKVQQWY